MQIQATRQRVKGRAFCMPDRLYVRFRKRPARITLQSLQVVRVAAGRAFLTLLAGEC